MTSLRDATVGQLEAELARRKGEASRKDWESAAVAAVVAHYKSLHPRARPGESERKKIRARLKEGWTVADLQAAIDGNHRDPHCCGENDRGKLYHSLELCVRDSKHVQDYIEAPLHTPSAKERRAVRAGDDWLAHRARVEGRHLDG